MTHAHLKFIIAGSALFISAHQPLLTRDFLGFPKSILEGCLCVHGALLWAVLPLKGLFLYEYFSCHTFGAFSVVQWRASENYEFSDILIVCLLVHAFIDLFIPSSKSRNYLGKKGVSRQKEQEITEL